MKALLFLVAALPLGSAPSLAQELQLVGGDNHMCILDAEGAKCWGGARRGLPIVMLPGGPCLQNANSAACKEDDKKIAPAFKAFNNPEKIWAGSENTCVQHQQGLSCFGRIDTPEDERKLTGVDGVAVGASHVCAYHDRNYKCYGLDGKWVDPHPGRRTFVPDDGDDLGGSIVHELMVAGGISTCKVMTDSIQCYAQWEVSNVGPRYHVAAKAAAMKFIDLCTLEKHMSQCSTGTGTGVACRRLHEADSVPGGVAFQVCPAEFHQPEQVALNETHVCVRDADGVGCIERKYASGNFAPVRRMPALGRPEQIAMAGSTICALEGFTLTCYDFDASAVIPTPVAATSLALFSFRLEVLDKVLAKIGDYVYQDKAAFFTGLSQVAARDSAAKHRLMVLNLIAPVVESTTTPFFQRSVTPVMKKRLEGYNNDNGVHSLADFGWDDETRTVALEAMALAIRTTTDYLTNPAARTRMEAALGACGQALASGGSASAVRSALPALKAAEADFSTLAASDQAEGRGLMMLAALAYLGGE